MIFNLRKEPPIHSDSHDYCVILHPLQLYARLQLLHIFINICTLLSVFFLFWIFLHTWKIFQNLPSINFKIYNNPIDSFKIQELGVRFFFPFGKKISKQKQGTKICKFIQEFHYRTNRSTCLFFLCACLTLLFWHGPLFWVFP